jgi:glucose/arabinose dehydrogenase
MKKPLLSSLLIFISVYLFAQPGNNNCANAAWITTDSTCVTGASRLTNQTLTGASNEAYTITSSCGMSQTARDVWYRFIAKTKNPVITVSNPGSGWVISNIRMQLLSGTCGSFTEMACGTSGSLTPSLTNPLTEGVTYYIRIHKNTTSTIGTNHTFNICVTDALTKASRMKEVFSRTVLSGASAMNNPWEVTYGPDEKLWVTDSKNYRVYRIDPNTGAKVTVLDISQNSTTAPDNSFRCLFDNGSGAQGGLAGLALHPNFMNGTANENNSVYISYIYSGSGSYFTNRLVRFIYNPGTNRLVSPVSICDSLPGSNDHNSQRMIIAPEVAGGPKYLFYASGDMGAGQGNATNRARTIRAQFPNSYEGKILRFNLEEDGDAVQTPATINYNRWIPNDNPYNAMLGKQSAVWNIGQRNNQGFVYDTAAHILYGSSHGAYSDDEINILERGRNYGHPLVIGFAADGNYNGTTTPSTNTSISAGAPFPVGSGNSTCPPIGNEASNAATITSNGNGAYKDPLFSGYPGATGTGTGSVANIWRNNPGNDTWPSEGWSGLDLYTNKMIPGWKRSLVASGLKWGRLIRLKLGTDGNTTLPSNLAYQNTSDTVLYFQSSNRYRDIAFGPNGRDIYVIMDNNAASAATDGNPPVTPACAGCLVKYSFLGYADNGGKSSIPAAVDVTAGVDNTINQGTTITIDGTNSHLWVPITGPDGNIMAEINAMGQSLGVITSAFYTHSGPTRVKKGFRYLNRNITITPAVTSFAIPVKVRLYITRAEFNLLDADLLSGITTGIGQLKILKNADPCGATLTASTMEVAKTNSGVDLEHGPNGYVLQGDVSSFSSFYFGAINITLPLDLITFKGSLQNNATLLQWETANENNTSHFAVERSTDGRSFEGIGTVAALGNSVNANKYSYIDNNVSNLSSTIIYYRLKMIDADGQYSYSQVITIYLADITGRVVISPNPAKHETRVMITASLSGTVKWKLVDNNGRVVMQDAVYVNRGSNNFTINLNSLSGGLYYLNISGAGIDQNMKLQKL